MEFRKIAYPVGGVMLGAAGAYLLNEFAIPETSSAFLNGLKIVGAAYLAVGCGIAGYCLEESLR